MAFSFRNLFSGIRIVPKTTSTVTVQGDLDITSGDGKINYFNGTTPSPLVTESHAAPLTNKTIDADLNTISNIDNNEIKAAAGIVYSKLNLTNGIVNADINVAAAIAYSKLNLTNSIVNADINAAAAIAYSKLTLTNSIVNSDINASAAIDRSKLASGTPNHVLINDGLGAFSSEATLAKSRGGSGQDNSSITFPASGVLVTEAGVETLSNKSFSDSVTIAEVATPSTPSSGFGRIYFKSDGNVYSLNDGGTENQLLTATSLEDKPNFLFNSNFDIWQRGITSTGSGASYYLADRWNIPQSSILGTGAPRIQCDRVSGVSDGAKYGMSVKVSVAPTVGSGSGVFATETLENFDSLQVFNKTVSFRAKVKALGNVNQATLQLNYQTSETRINPAVNTLGSQAATINSATFTTITLSNIAVGSAMTVNGVVGVAILATGVSSGALGDVNNGFIVEQAELVIGSPFANYKSKFTSIAEELEGCERYYEKSYNMGLFPGDTSSSFQGTHQWLSANASYRSGIDYSVRKRVAPTITIYNPVTGATNSMRNRSAAANIAVANGDVGEHGNNFSADALAVGEHFSLHWVADAEI